MENHPRHSAEPVGSITPHEHPREQDIDPATGKITLAGLIGLGTGAVGGFLTSLGLSSKLFSFDADVLKKTRNDILNRTGNAANAANTGLNGLAAGMSNQEIEQANRYIAAEAKEFSLARRVMKLGGRSNVSLMVGGATGILGFIGAMALIPKRTPKEEIYSAEITLPEGYKVVNAAAEEVEAASAPKKNWREDVEKQAADKAAAEPAAQAR